MQTLKNQIYQVLKFDAKLKVDFRPVTRTAVHNAIRTGFQEYRIALELAPDLIISAEPNIYDSVIKELGIPYVCLADQLDQATIDSISKLLKDGSWTFPQFAGVIPNTISQAKKITILGDGCHRNVEDEGTVIALSPLQMFTTPEPDFFIREEYGLRLSIPTDSAISNKWVDQVDTGFNNLPLQLGISLPSNAVEYSLDSNCPIKSDTNNPAFWRKGIEIRSLPRTTIGCQCSLMIWSAYAQFIHPKCGRINSSFLSLVIAIRKVNPNAELVYRWKRKDSETPHEVLEKMIFKDDYKPSRTETDVAEVGIKPKIILVKCEAFDLNLTFSGYQLANWLYHHRINYQNSTYVAGSDCFTAFMQAQGFPTGSPEQEPEVTLQIQPTPLYPA